MKPLFDPFSDRTARDIRNGLSSALVAHLAGDEVGAVGRVAELWLAKGIGSPYEAYIRDRRKRYADLINVIESRDILDVRLQAIEMWNAGLFFEMHELLETIWHPAQGVERQALKGLIQAAGVYVHQQRGHLKAARGLARRARENLLQAGAGLPFIRNLDALIASLEEPQSIPENLIPN